MSASQIVPGMTTNELGGGAIPRATHHSALGLGRFIAGSVAQREPQGEFELIGTDDRVPVLNTIAIPFRWICALDLFFPDVDNPSYLFRFRGSAL
jgi:hypothetical protein